MIFIVGNSRSGTTMMGRILGNNKDVYTFHELHYFEQLWSLKDKKSNLDKAEVVELLAKLLNIQRVGYLSKSYSYSFIDEAEKLAATIPLSDSTSASIFRKFLYYEAEKEGKKNPCDQTPRNVFYIGDILDLFPEARIINMIRDPRDVMLSQKWKWKRRFLGAKNIPLRESLRSWINYHPMIVSKLWNASLRSADRYQNESRVESVHFEKLISSPTTTIRKICDFLGIRYSGNMLNIPKVGSSTNTDRSGNLGIDKSRHSNWQSGGLNSTEMYISQKATLEFRRKHGYDDIVTSPNPLLLALYITSLPIKLSLALLVNRNRMRNIVEAISRRI